uniref:Uncharacterized protein n=1 Tax=viral metagenome TaxID=1070528 RepID=A0A6C0CTA0_9ZZZZ
MKAIAVFLLFIGMFLVVQGYYQESTKCPTPKVEVKYIPRSLYEEQLSDKQKLQVHFKSMFEDVTPWLLMQQ